MNIDPASYNDDGFNDFVHDRTNKRSVNNFSCMKANSSTMLNVEGFGSKADIDFNYSNCQDVSELLRSEGSGSENGVDSIKDEVPCYDYNKKARHGAVPTATPLSIAKHKYTCLEDWRSKRMESFESNKGSEFNCPIMHQLATDDYCSDEDWECGQPTGERWPPLGAPNDDDVSICSFEELGRLDDHYSF